MIFQDMTYDKNLGETQLEYEKVAPYRDPYDDEFVPQDEVCLDWLTHTEIGIQKFTPFTLHQRNSHDEYPVKHGRDWKTKVIDIKGKLRILSPDVANQLDRWKAPCRLQMYNVPYDNNIKKDYRQCIRQDMYTKYAVSDCRGVLLIPKPPSSITN
jgi:hypothetical protein